ncbi:Hsp20/alpha crystallin family protein [Azospirillum sp. ST 5-10]|uniref:Hsp20/alpha crystallin family protein n=1 Tax=unclassified Azospirillum TaxID=2630922 RepID=UPI003F49BD0E
MDDTTLTKEPSPESKSTGAVTKPAGEAGRHPFLTLRDEFDRLFDEATAMFHLPWSRRSPFDLEPLFRTEAKVAFLPPADVDERDGEYLVTMELPGMDEKAVEVAVQDGVLTVKAEKKEEREEKSKTRTFSERRYGLCERSFRLPGNVDQERIAAAMRNGVLTVTLPKTEPAAPPKRTVEIKTS